MSDFRAKEKDLSQDIEGKSNVIVENGRTKSQEEGNLSSIEVDEKSKKYKSSWGSKRKEALINIDVLFKSCFYNKFVKKNHFRF